MEALESKEDPSLAVEAMEAQEATKETISKDAYGLSELAANYATVYGVFCK